MADEQKSGGKGGKVRRHDWRLGRAPGLTKAILGNETRFAVLVEVARGVGRVTPIAEHLGLERYDVSKHMGKLFLSGLVQLSVENPEAYELAPNVAVRVDATGVDVVVTGEGMALRVAVTNEEE